MSHHLVLFEIFIYINYLNKPIGLFYILHTEIVFSQTKAGAINTV